MTDRLRLVSPAEADPGVPCPSPDACGWPRLCLPGRCIAAETIGSPHAGMFRWPAPVPLAPHCPPELTLLRGGLPDDWTETPDRQPAAPRHLPRGGHLLAVLVWACACWLALGTAAWAIHWIIFS